MARKVTPPKGEGEKPDVIVVRTGACVALADCRLCWIELVAGQRYTFEERSVWNGADRIGQYRVTDGTNEGYACPSWFREKFKEASL